MPWSCSSRIIEKFEPLHDVAHELRELIDRLAELDQGVRPFFIDSP